jgi:hypothetical protein
MAIIWVTLKKGFIQASGVKGVPPQDLVDAILDSFSEGNPDDVEYRLSAN